MKYFYALPLLLSFMILSGLNQPLSALDFRIRTITAGVNLSDLDDRQSILQAIDFLARAESEFTEQGYEVQTLRIATQNLHEIIDGDFNTQVMAQLVAIDKILIDKNIMLSVGELLDGDKFQDDLSAWTALLVNQTSNISFNIPIASTGLGIHDKSIKLAATICKALAENSPGGEANFRFTASANCPAGIPFFPAAFHQGPQGFAIGLEYPNLITRVFEGSNWTNADENLQAALEAAFKPVEAMGKGLETPEWTYYGLDTSPAPGLDASIGQSIETLTGRPFGSHSTLRACGLITGVIKQLDLKICGYSGLMLPVIEDQVLAQRAMERRYSVDELLLYSSVSGTGLDVVPLAGDITEETLTGIYQDLAALSLKYFNKPLSARLFPIPGKKAGEMVKFENPYLTGCIVLDVD